MHNLQICMYIVSVQYTYSKYTQNMLMMERWYLKETFSFQKGQGKTLLAIFASEAFRMITIVIQECCWVKNWIWRNLRCRWLSPIAAKLDWLLLFFNQRCFLHSRDAVDNGRDGPKESGMQKQNGRRSQTADVDSPISPECSRGLSWKRLFIPSPFHWHNNEAESV